MALTTIQLHEETKKNLDSKKIHPRESYEAVINRILELDSIPSMEEMFKQADNMKLKKKYTTKELIKISHQLRGKR